jgi:hypothetical protein
MEGPRSRSTVLVLIAFLALVAVLAACGEEAPEPSASPSPTTSPEVSPSVEASPTPTAAETTPAIAWRWLREGDYRSWERPPGWDERRTTDSPHSQAKEIFVDEALAETIGAGAARVPAGATIVKEGYDSSGELAIVAAMQRLPGEGWFFAEYRADGSVIIEDENPQLCTQCHQGAQDGVLAFDLE